MDELCSCIHRSPLGTQFGQCANAVPRAGDEVYTRMKSCNDCPALALVLWRRRHGPYADNPWRVMVVVVTVRTARQLALPEGSRCQTHSAMRSKVPALGRAASLG